MEPAINPTGERDEGGKPRIGDVYQAFARITESLTTDASRIVALFLLLPLTAIVAFIFAPQTPLVAGAILSLVLLALVMTVYLLWHFDKKQRQSGRKKPSFLRRIGVLSLLGAASVLLFLVLQHVGILAKALPSLYPEQAAVDAVHRFYKALNGVLAATTDDQRAAAIVTLGKTMTPDFQKRNLPKGCAEVLSRLQSKPDDDEAWTSLRKHAVIYSGWFGRANGAYVDLIGNASWQRIQLSESRHVLHVLAVVRFSGRFVDNTFPNSKMRVRDLSLALTDPASPQRIQLVRWLEEQFPSMDRAQMDVILSQLLVTDLGEANAFDLVGYRLGKDKLGDRSESPYRFGNEVSFVSIRLEKDVVVDSAWRIAEIGRWGMKHIFTEEPPRDSVLSTDRRLIVDDVPYYSQDTPVLCQSACLQMMAEFVSAQSGRYSQGNIRKSLEAIGDPLAHNVRVRWLSNEFPKYSWKMKYITSLPEAGQCIRRQLVNKLPIILSTRLTRSGHVIVVTGIWYDSDGELIVRAHDPWGRFNFETLQYDRHVGVGRDVEYPLSKLFVRNRKWISPNGTAESSQYSVGTEEWNPTTSVLFGKGLGIGATTTDWEFIEAEAANAIATSASEDSSQ